ncbi:MAG: UdgX family uracil-DNA binding protein [Rhodospirillales bacterium]|nr:UdgX family uracil-DNA binding protein [Rhodospirillales bacterium]
MIRVALAGETDWAGWRQATRALVLAGIDAAGIVWQVGGPADALPGLAADAGFTVPRALLALAGQAIQARDPSRFDLLFRLIASAHAAGAPDPAALAAAQALARAVRADTHRLRTQLRFLPLPDGRLLSWYAPAHFVLAANAALIAARAPGRALSIATPDLTVHADADGLRCGPGIDAPADDAALVGWWRAQGSAALAVATPCPAPPPAETLEEMARPPDRPALAAVVLPPRADPALAAAAAEAGACMRCPIAALGTSAVFGEGPSDARLMLIGEQPGDQEDVIGRPFVGPAGQMLDRALEEAGLDRRLLYVTNAVKHFKFVARGGRRIHQSPEAGEIEACRFWLEQELTRLDPRVLVLLGGSAGRAMLGRPVSVGRERGRPFALGGRMALLTVHPSFLLRLPDAAAQAREYAAMVADLALAGRLAATA